MKSYWNTACGNSSKDFALSCAMVKLGTELLQDIFHNNVYSNQETVTSSDARKQDSIHRRSSNNLKEEKFFVAVLNINI